MKYVKKILGIAAIIAVIGFSIAACNDNTGSNGTDGEGNDSTGSNGTGGGDNSSTDFEYSNEDELGNTIMITGYKGAGGNITIPEKINGKPVTGIWLGAFRSNTRLTSVTIPDSVTWIGQSAFDSCTSLTSVTIGNSVTRIGIAAFSITNIKSLTIPNSVNYIEERAFAGCDNLTSVTIPNSVTYIGQRAFICTNLTSVTFEGTITSMSFNSSAFWGGLRDQYLQKGIGTYTTTAPVSSSSVWTKQ